MYNLSICGIKKVSSVWRFTRVFGDTGFILFFKINFCFAVRRNGECIVFLDVSFAFEERVYFL